MITLQPACASALAVSTPRPELAPTGITTFDADSLLALLLQRHSGRSPVTTAVLPLRSVPRKASVAVLLEPSAGAITKPTTRKQVKRGNTWKDLALQTLPLDYSLLVLSIPGVYLNIKQDLVKQATL